MSKILVKGLGVVEIAGEVPTEEEEFLIAEQLQEASRIGTADRPGEARAITKEEFGKASRRESIEDLPAILEFLAEMAPATSLSAAGGSLGLPAGPVGVGVGAGIGGLLGEILGQESGISPENELAKPFAALSPIGGTAVGGGLKLGRRLLGGSLTTIPPARAALGRLAEREAVEDFESLGSKVIAKQTGLMSRPSSVLYQSARRTGAVVPGKELKNTSAALAQLDDELKIIADFPEGKQAIDLIDRTIAALGGQEPISFDTFIKTRQLVGAALDRAERASGVRLGSAKRLFKAMSDDIDTIAKGTTKARRPAKIAQTAAKRAKLEFSVKDMDAAVARFTKDVPGDETAAQLNVVGLQKWFRDVTNPKSVKFDKNFSESLRKEVPAVRKHLSDLAKLAEDTNPAGRGSIVVRGIGAKTGRTIIGGMIGFGVAGPLGGGVGALAGASLPEMVTALLMSPQGARMLKRAVRLGKGDIPAQRWAFLGQLVNQVAGAEVNDSAGGIKTLGNLQRRAVEDIGQSF